MILKYPFEKGLDGNSGADTHYYGKDAEDFLRSINWDGDIKYLGKECTTSRTKQKGIIVGIEDSESAMDYYFIVFVPDTGEVFYELCNSPFFIKTVII